MSLLWNPQPLTTVTANGTVIAYGTLPYPPVPILWMTAAMDTICIPFEYGGGWHWRKFLLGIDTVYEAAPSSPLQQEQQEFFQEDSFRWWFAYRVPSVRNSFPKLLTFAEFSKRPEQQQQQQHVLVKSLYRYAFETPDTDLGDLLTPTALTACLCLVLLLRLCKRKIVMPIFSAWGKRAAIATHGPDWAVHNTERIAKFGEYCFRLLYHSFIAAYGAYFFCKEPYWVGPGRSHNAGYYLYDGYPHQTIAPQMAWYYLLQAAYNVDALLSLAEISFCLRRRQRPTLKQPKQHTTTSTTKKFKDNDPNVILSLPVFAGNSSSSFCYQLCWSDTVRGDFREMAMHHVVTNCLVIGSSICRLTRAGSMVFWVHDVSDVPVDLSKLANFVKKKYTTLACFLSMCLTWFYTRLFILPFVIFTALYVDSERLMHNGLPVLIYKCYLHFFISWMMLLILLHTVWFVMFLRMFATFVQKREMHDLSEHKQGEDQPQPPPTTTIPAMNGKHKSTTTTTTTANGGRETRGKKD